MSIAKTSENSKCNSLTADSLEGMAGAMEKWILTAAEQGMAFHRFESAWHEMVYRLANLGTGLFISQQRDGDLGETVTTEEGVTAKQSADRLQPEQPLIALMDGSPSQWDARHGSLDPDVSARMMELLDLLHETQRNAVDH